MKTLHRAMAQLGGIYPCRWTALPTSDAYRPEQECNQRLQRC
ncbi:hypothetical protein BSLA_01r4344 [Burkholderia stabilis]|nr:hypothetical protein BSLA_01r4344 [Burkholderia stabilis]